MMKAMAGLLGVAGLAWAFRDVPRQLGGRPDPVRMSRSPRYRDGKFHNDKEVRTVPNRDFFSSRDFLFGGEDRTPAAEVPLVAPEAPVSTGVHITWYGHASALVEVDGAAVLLDPVWSDRASPSSCIGPKRLHPVPHQLSDLPELSAVVISHDHYDHLDMMTVQALTAGSSAVFVVPLGVGAHLSRWDVPASRVVELDWNESHSVDGFTLTCAAAQHFSNRSVQRNLTLWASWVIARGNRSVFYSGDTGYFAGYKTIGEVHGPFDAVLMQVGAYDDAWPDIHMTPEEGIQAFDDLGGGLLIPVHWATFDLGLHPWGEPVDWMWREAKAAGLAFVVPRPGERVDVDSPREVDGWWQALGTGSEPSTPSGPQNRIMAFLSRTASAKGRGALR